MSEVANLKIQLDTLREALDDVLTTGNSIFLAREIHKSIKETEELLTQSTNKVVHQN